VHNQEFGYESAGIAEEGIDTMGELCIKVFKSAITMIPGRG
jgi:hypothetical protein